MINNVYFFKKIISINVFKNSLKIKLELDF